MYTYVYEYVCMYMYIYWENVCWRWPSKSEFLGSSSLAHDFGGIRVHDSLLLRLDDDAFFLILIYFDRSK